MIVRVKTMYIDLLFCQDLLFLQMRVPLHSSYRSAFLNLIMEVCIERIILSTFLWIKFAICGSNLINCLAILITYLTDVLVLASFEKLFSPCPCITVRDSDGHTKRGLCVYGAIWISNFYCCYLGEPGAGVYCFHH